MKPQRIRLSRARGWRMPANTVKVDRTTKFGNPFIVGEGGLGRAECVKYFQLLCLGKMCISISHACCDRQKKFIKHAKAHLGDLRGKNLACWCPLGQPCHADVLLDIANRKAPA